MDASSLHVMRILYVVLLRGNVIFFLTFILVIISGPCGRLARVCGNFKSGTGSKQKEREGSKSELLIQVF